jgi:hypothetical protein
LSQLEFVFMKKQNQWQNCDRDFAQSQWLIWRSAFGLRREALLPVSEV